MLAIWFAESGDKAPPFTPIFQTLGLLVSVEKLHEGAFTLEHTESRMNEVTQTLQT